MILRALMHNEREYPNPSAFNPDRFLSPDGRINSSVRDPASVGFGFGRRFVYLSLVVFGNLTILFSHHPFISL